MRWIETAYVSVPLAACVDTTPYISQHFVASVDQKPPFDRDNLLEHLPRFSLCEMLCRYPPSVERSIRSVFPLLPPLYGWMAATR